MSKVEVGGMKWEQMVELVERRFNKLAMCKRGAIHTDINNQKDKLGKRPVITKEEKAKITAGLLEKRKKALTPSIALVRKYEYDISGLQSHLYNKVRKMEEDCYLHPGLEKWKEDIRMIENQYEAREAALDGDFQDVLDSFMLKLWDLDELPAKYLEMEQKEW